MTCCTPIGEVDSVVMPEPLASMPYHAEGVMGMFHYRDKTVALLSLHHKFGLPIPDDPLSGRFVVAYTEHGLTGFWVDEVLEISSDYPADWSPAPYFDGPSPFEKTLYWQERICLYSRFDKLLTTPSVNALAHYAPQGDVVAQDAPVLDAVVSPQIEEPVPAALVLVEGEDVLPVGDELLVDETSQALAAEMPSQLLSEQIELPPARPELSDSTPTLISESEPEAEPEPEITQASEPELGPRADQMAPLDEVQAGEETDDIVGLLAANVEVAENPAVPVLDPAADRSGPAAREVEWPAAAREMHSGFSRYADEWDGLAADWNSEFPPMLTDVAESNRPVSELASLIPVDDVCTPSDSLIIMADSDVPVGIGDLSAEFAQHAEILSEIAAGGLLSDEVLESADEHTPPDSLTVVAEGDETTELDQPAEAVGDIMEAGDLPGEVADDVVSMPLSTQMIIADEVVDDATPWTVPAELDVPVSNGDVADEFTKFASVLSEFANVESSAAPAAKSHPSHGVSLSRIFPLDTAPVTEPRDANQVPQDQAPVEDDDEILPLPWSSEVAEATPDKVEQIDGEARQSAQNPWGPTTLLDDSDVAMDAVSVGLVDGDSRCEVKSNIIDITTEKEKRKSHIVSRETPLSPSNPPARLRVPAVRDSAVTTTISELVDLESELDENDSVLVTGTVAQKPPAVPPRPVESKSVAEPFEDTHRSAKMLIDDDGEPVNYLVGVVERAREQYAQMHQADHLVRRRTSGLFSRWRLLVLLLILGVLIAGGLVWFGDGAPDSALRNVQSEPAAVPSSLPPAQNVSSLDTPRKAIGDEPFDIHLSLVDVALLHRYLSYQEDGPLWFSIDNQVIAPWQTYRVLPNDTLWDIAQAYLNNPFRYDDLARWSQINNPDRIYPGDKVLYKPTPVTSR